MTRRCGYVALVGAPNAGKSTLLNLLVGTKLSIVTPKVQTTRSRVLGIALKGDAQLIFIDTPGIFAPKRRLDRAMVAAAWAGAEDADIVVVLVDAARGIDDDTRRILDRLKTTQRRRVLALNKIDLVKREQLLPLAGELSQLCDFERVFMISSTAGDGIADLGDFLAGAVPEAPWLFPRISSPICRSACLPPKSRASRSIFNCIKSCLTPPPSKPSNGKSARTAASRSAR